MFIKERERGGKNVLLQLRVYEHFHIAFYLWLYTLAVQSFTVENQSWRPTDFYKHNKHKPFCWRWNSPKFTEVSKRWVGKETFARCRRKKDLWLHLNGCHLPGQKEREEASRKVIVFLNVYRPNLKHWATGVVHNTAIEGSVRNKAWLFMCWWS